MPNAPCSHRWATEHFLKLGYAGRVRGLRSGGYISAPWQCRTGKGSHSAFLQRQIIRNTTDCSLKKTEIMRSFFYKFLGN